MRQQHMRRTHLPGLIAVLGSLAVGQAPDVPAERRTLVLDRAPVRVIQDPYPAFHGITMEPSREEVILTDNNTASLLVYSSQFQATERMMEPRRKIAGPTTHVGYVCSVAVSPQHAEIYSVDNDWKDSLLTFPLDGSGDIEPRRELNVDHGAWGLFLEPTRDELFVTVQHVNKLSVYRRTAQGDDDPLRYIQGPRTELADPHGVFVDAARAEVFVSSHGSWRRTEPGEGYTLFFGKRAQRLYKGPPKPLVPSTGRFVLPSITVFPSTASGDVAPIRTIQGPKTGLNWPLGIFLDAESGELAVANGGDDSILFFDRAATGDVPPSRIIRGPSTELDGPTAVFIDQARDEIWVSNWNNHSATVYARAVSGNAAPRRVLRSAPKGTSFPGLGNPGAIVYDTKRQQLIVPT
jgi:DNA-binding beta-propeller fold protein YncE